ncbi:hypothetical protein vBEcoMWL3_gp109c [Escherichia phage vB_EcoM_WL-3]|nr:hypothetical protein vBEcoMWL3_gp109c [Escherichia phage vB_EcoM_WL-3]
MKVLDLKSIKTQKVITLLALVICLLKVHH